MQSTKDNLSILAVFHYVVGAFSIAMSFIPVIYLIVGCALVIYPMPPESGGGTDRILIGWIMVVIATLIIVTGIVIATGAIIAGFCLTRRKKIRFCIAVAIAECVFFPMGTALGVITLSILSKPDIRNLFNNSSKT